MATKLCEHTYGAYTYMRLRLDSGRVEEIVVFYRESGMSYKTSADHAPQLREQIIAAFNALF